MSPVPVESGPYGPVGSAAADAAAALRAAGAAGSIADHLGVLADGLAAAADALPAGTLTWSGLAGEVAASMLATRVRSFRAAQGACRAAGSALADHAQTLTAVAELYRLSAQAPVDLAAQLRVRAAAIGDGSAHRTAGTLTGLAASAPAPGNRLTRAVLAGNEWGAEVTLGTAEAVAGLSQLLIRAGGVLASGDPRALASVGRGVLDSFRHPGALLAAVTDWDTWRSNPARAAGHLLPDAIAAVATGGVAATRRAATVAARTRSAAAAAAERMRARPDELARGEARRQELLDRALKTRPEPGAKDWSGVGETTLPAAEAAAARAFRARALALEVKVTEAIKAVARAAGAQLEGLEYRIKGVETTLRKVATREPGDTLATMLLELNDLLRFTVVLAPGDYVAGSLQFARDFERLGLTVVKVKNFWDRDDAYRGLNTTWREPASGVEIEVQFHTPLSAAISKATRPLFEEERLPNTSPERAADLERQQKEAFDRAPLPPGVKLLNPETFPPPIPPDAIEVPVDYTVTAAIGGAAAAQAGQAEQRLEQRLEQRKP